MQVRRVVWGFGLGGVSGVLVRKGEWCVLVGVLGRVSGLWSRKGELAVGRCW